MKIEMVKKDVVANWLTTIGPSPLLAMLFGGDRWEAADEVIVARDDEGKILGLVSLSMRGEMDSGEPTIIGLYVLPAQRRQGIGTSLFARAVERLVERGARHVRVDVLTAPAAAMMKKIAPRQEWGDVLDPHIQPFLPLEIFEGGE